MNIKKEIQNEIVEFYKGTQYNPNIKINLIITEDLYKKRKSLIFGPTDEEVVRNNKENLQRYNGTIALGENVTDPMYVIISYNTFDIDEFTWIGTIHHEYTHAHDHYDYLNFCKLIKSDDIYDTEYYDEFVLWSEFHARLKGYTRMLSYMYGNHNVSEIYVSLLDLIAINYINNPTDYNLMKFLGRLIALIEKYNDILEYIDIDKMFENSSLSIGRITRLYSLLKPAKTFDYIKYKFDDLRFILQAY